MPTAIITGASTGLGRALADHLLRDGWRVVVDARTAADLHEAAVEWAGGAAAGTDIRGTDADGDRAGRGATGRSATGRSAAVVLAGDVTDDGHRRELVTAAGDRLDLLVLNASSLGQTPLPPLARYRADELRAVLETNTVAPLLLVQLALPALRAAGGRVLAISSDAAVEGYPGWGGYGASKAALDQLIRVLGAEEPGVRAYAVDPGDMRTRMHAAAFPGEDISDRPTPESVVPALRRLIDADLPAGRYTADQLREVSA